MLFPEGWGGGGVHNGRGDSGFTRTKGGGGTKF